MLSAAQPFLLSTSLSLSSVRFPFHTRHPPLDAPPHSSLSSPPLQVCRFTRESEDLSEAAISAFLSKSPTESPAATAAAAAPKRRRSEDGAVGLPPTVASSGGSGRRRSEGQVAAVAADDFGWGPRRRSADKPFTSPPPPPPPRKSPSFSGAAATPVPAPAAAAAAAAASGAAAAGAGEGSAVAGPKGPGYGKLSPANAAARGNMHHITPVGGGERGRGSLGERG